MPEQNNTRPSVARLERNNILQDIIDNIEQFREKFHLVDYRTLKDDVLKPVLAGDFDPEVQIRGFLRTFRRTEVFQAALEDIGSPDLKDQIQAFADGRSAKQVVQKGGINVSRHASPPVKSHFSLLERLKELVLRGLHLQEKIVKDAHVKEKHGHLADLPIVYEDSDKKKVIEVSYENFILKDL